jgi:hypothetical protein
MAAIRPFAGIARITSSGASGNSEMLVTPGNPATVAAVRPIGDTLPG